LGALLDPLKLKITEFQSKIEDTYVKEGQERSALGVELKHLKELNQQLSEDAKNLTRALRGSANVRRSTRVFPSTSPTGNPLL
jgi:DNA recombination protein RmuC